MTAERILVAGIALTGAIVGFAYPMWCIFWGVA